MTPFAAGTRCTYHVFLAKRGEQPLDMTAGRDLTYPQAREILLGFAASFPQLHEPGFPSHLEIHAWRGGS